MSRRLLFSSEQVVSALLRLGFEIARQKGSHASLRRRRADGGHDVTVVVLDCNPLPKGTLLGILKQGNVSYEEFLDAAKVKRKRRRRE